ncbi:MAG TPA: hypothetical protein VJX67_17600 [Blastocatellia bacterium]|nr:hypothetical protein [Blastocatellia bacterium]
MSENHIVTVNVLVQLSAVQFILDNPGSTALIASQDGELLAIKAVDHGIICLRQLELMI